jgi:hypothetical protein
MAIAKRSTATTRTTTKTTTKKQAPSSRVSGASYVGSGGTSKIKQKGNGGDGRFFYRVQEGTTLVRFMAEPSEWVKFREHYDDVRKFFPCTTDDCPGCAEKRGASERYLSNVVLVDDSKVVVLLMPKTLASRIVNRWERWGTIVDRDIAIIRTGTTKDDTEYDAEGETPRAMKMDRFTPIDVWEMLEAQIDDGEDDDEDDEDDEPVTTRRSSIRRK